MVGEEVFESACGKIIILHGDGLPGKGVVLLHRTACSLHCPAEVVAGDGSSLGQSVRIVGCVPLRCANAIAIVGEIPLHGIGIVWCVACPTGKFDDTGDAVLGVVILLVSHTGFGAAGHIAVGVVGEVICVVDAVYGGHSMGLVPIIAVVVGVPA